MKEELKKKISVNGYSSIIALAMGLWYFIVYLGFRSGKGFVSNLSMGWSVLFFVFCNGDS